MSIFDELSDNRTMINAKQKSPNVSLSLIDNVFKILPSMGIILDEDLNVIAANDKFYDLFELNQDITGKHFSEFFDNYTFINSLGSFVKSSEISTSINQRMLLKKEYLYYKIHFTKLSAEEKCIFIWCEEQTKQVVQHNEIDALKSQIKKSTKLVMIGEMTSGIAQEFSSPLMILSNSIKQLKRSINEDSIDRNGVVTKLDFINKSINKLLSLSKNIDLCAKSTETEEINNIFVTDIINRSLELCGERLKNSDVKLIVDFIEPNLNIDCRISQVTQSILNLVNTSINVHPEVEDKRLNVSAYDNEEYIRFNISTNQIANFENDLEENPALFLAKETANNHFGHFYIEQSIDNQSYIFDIPKGLVPVAI